MLTIRDTYVFTKFNGAENVDRVLGEVGFNSLIPDPIIIEPRNEELRRSAKPISSEILSAIKSGSVVPALVREPKINVQESVKDRLLRIPIWMFNFTYKDPKKGFITAVDISSKARYVREKGVSIGKGTIKDVDIDENGYYTFMFYGYAVNKLYKLFENGSIRTHEDIARLFASYYSLLLTKCIDKSMPMNSTEAYEYLHFILACFCLETFFGIPKERAINIAKKIKFVNESTSFAYSTYLKTKITFLDGVDYKTRFPIENLIDLLKKEFNTYKADRFNLIFILAEFSRTYGQNTILAIESILGLLSLFIFSEGRMRLFNDFNILKNTELIRKELSKNFINFIVKN